MILKFIVYLSLFSFKCIQVSGCVLQAKLGDNFALGLKTSRWQGAGDGR